MKETIAVKDANTTHPATKTSSVMYPNAIQLNRTEPSLYSLYVGNILSPRVKETRIVIIEKYERDLFAIFENMRIPAKKNDKMTGRKLMATDIICKTPSLKIST